MRSIVRLTWQWSCTSKLRPPMRSNCRNKQLGQGHEFHRIDVLHDQGAIGEKSTPTRVFIQNFGKVPQYLLKDFQVSLQFYGSGPNAGYAFGVPIPGRDKGDPSYWGFVHTHWANDGDFSPADKDMAAERNINAYVIFPDESYKFIERK